MEEKLEFINDDFYREMRALEKAIRDKNEDEKKR